MGFIISEKISDDEFINGDHLEIDIHLDTRGVVLEKPIYCAHCMIRMNKVGQEKYRCPHCRVVFNNSAA